MPWAYIHLDYTDHPKMRALLAEPRGLDASGLWTFGISYAARQQTSLIRRGMIRRCLPPGTEALADLLCQHDLWCADPLGWRIVSGSGLCTWRQPGWTCSPALRKLIFERDGYACQHCGTSDNLTIDHINPRLLGGGDEPENLQALCRSCNSRKGARV